MIRLSLYVSLLGVMVLLPACTTQIDSAPAPEPTPPTTEFRFVEEGPTPPLLRSIGTSTGLVTSVTGKQMPDTDEYSPAIVDNTDVAFVTSELGNLDIRSRDFRSQIKTAIKNLVCTESNEKAPFVVLSETGGGKCYFVTDSGPSFSVFSGSLPMVRSQLREGLGNRHANWPHISKDKTKMLYSMIGPKGTYDVWMRDLVTGGESRITEGQRARWNPNDPDEFVFTHQLRGAWTLCKYSFRSGQERDLNQGPADKFDPEYSPDGEWISFTSNEQGSSDIWVMRADGSEPRLIDKHGAIDCQAVWTPDGRSLLFTTNREGSFDICMVPFDEPAAAVAEPAVPATAGN